MSEALQPMEQEGLIVFDCVCSYVEIVQPLAIPKHLSAMTSIGRQNLEKDQEDSKTLPNISTRIIISSFLFFFLPQQEV